MAVRDYCAPGLQHLDDIEWAVDQCRGCAGCARPAASASASLFGLPKGIESMKRAHSSRPQSDTAQTRHIGMHLQGTARTDARVLREARALRDAGYVVSIVDTDPDTARPRVETFDGITL